jgi:hypothetical protein
MPSMTEHHHCHFDQSPNRSNHAREHRASARRICYDHPQVGIPVLLPVAYTGCLRRQVRDRRHGHVHPRRRRDRLRSSINHNQVAAGPTTKDNETVAVTAGDGRATGEAAKRKPSGRPPASVTLHAATTYIRAPSFPLCWTRRAVCTRGPGCCCARSPGCRLNTLTIAAGLPNIHLRAPRSADAATDRACVCDPAVRELHPHAAVPAGLPSPRLTRRRMGGNPAAYALRGLEWSECPRSNHEYGGRHVQRIEAREYYVCDR